MYSLVDSQDSGTDIHGQYHRNTEKVTRFRKRNGCGFSGHEEGVDSTHRRKRWEKLELCVVLLGSLTDRSLTEWIKFSCLPKLEVSRIGTSDFLWYIEQTFWQRLYAPRFRKVGKEYVSPK